MSNLIENGSHKYILQFTLPSGQKMNAARVGTKFALTPILENGMKGCFLIFNTPAEIKEFMKDLKKRNPVQFQMLWELKPEHIPVIITEVGIFPALKE